jgi:hypothetical protein
VLVAIFTESGEGGFLLLAFHSVNSGWIKGVAQTIPDDIEAKNSDHNEKTRKND